MKQGDTCPGKMAKKTNLWAMKAHYWAGFVTVNTISQHTDVRTWALHWLQRAQIAENKGNELVIFEVPTNNRLNAIEAIEGLLQSELGMMGSLTGSGSDGYINMGWVDALMMPPDEI
jgi:hypothetical protein